MNASQKQALETGRYHAAMRQAQRPLFGWFAIAGLSSALAVITGLAGLGVYGVGLGLLLLLLLDHLNRRVKSQRVHAVRAAFGRGAQPRRRRR